MRRIFIALMLCCASAAFAAGTAATGKVIKVLPFLVDHQGRIAKSPSLFDRDAYQAWLTRHPEHVSGLRYDIHWRAASVAGEKLKLRLELRGANNANVPQFKTIETDLAAGSTGGWAEVPLSGQDYRQFGAVVAWRVTLWSADREIAAQQSFLW